jgi:hypothetical protein
MAVILLILWDAQGEAAAVRFGDLHTFHRLRDLIATFQGSAGRDPMFSGGITRVALNSDAIYTRCPFVPLDLLPCGVEVQ